jgi:hypothetical protein
MDVCDWHQASYASPRDSVPREYEVRWAIRTGMEAWQTRTLSCLCQESDSNSSAVQSVAYLLNSLSCSRKLIVL